MANEPIITAEFLWRHHREALGGRSSITGQELPATLEQCPPGPQGSHWGMALAVAHALGHAEPPRPPGVSDEDADRIRRSIGVCSAG